MSHPYFDYCDSHDRHRLRTRPQRRSRRSAFFAALKTLLPALFARLAARSLSA
ncbi:hypothetical protein [Antarctobacter sp.]|uniref:hypothetical protein n=1 Tax=Antarctobacter sp. TaxID=1872577 RepID=UPI002B26624D|nr:hypothetical protein [Antarctobacter sp.]